MSATKPSHELLLSLFDLTGCVALVTGGSSGLGRIMAQTFAGAGAKVIVVARRRGELEAICASIAEQGGEARYIEADLSQRDGIPDLAKQAKALFGAPNILVNSAGINRRPKLDELSLDDWDQTMRLNLDAPFLLAQALAPGMRARGWGRIINLASLQSVRAFNNSGAYGVSKGGVLQLTRVLAEAWSKHGVTCNAIAPGFVRTPLTEPVLSDPQRAQALAARTMIGRNGELDDFRGIALLLASRASDYITGQTIFVDGGFSAY